jgi:hypothetical protein
MLRFSKKKRRAIKPRVVPKRGLQSRLRRPSSPQNQKCASEAPQWVNSQ